MSDVVIKVENLSKQYRLGEVGTGTISHDLNRWWARVRGKEDPFLKIGETNDRETKGESEYVWALRDIDFEVKQGEVLGIIGRNGAGKSTLLKILSKTTTPTRGSVKIKGRIASLLEVGTGFHPEMTGRENIFLNGAILGMTKREIKSKFDEIVDFAGIERYVDTPVKRYSSGMYVRLAFAVAAHLEPEILIVDEVLAVGDAEFQKKCLGKMKDVSKNDGRTVLFVSHNMMAVSTLCSKGLLLKAGALVDHADTRSIIDKYISSDKNTKGSVSDNEIRTTIQNGVIVFRKISLLVKQSVSNVFGLDEDVTIEIVYEVLNDTKVVPGVHILNNLGEVIFASFNSDSANTGKDKLFDRILSKGLYRTQCTIPKHFFNNSRYSVTAFLSTDSSFNNITVATEVLTFDVEETGNMGNEFMGNWLGMIRPKLEWNSIKIEEK